MIEKIASFSRNWDRFDIRADVHVGEATAASAPPSAEESLGAVRGRKTPLPQGHCGIGQPNINAGMQETLN